MGSCTLMGNRMHRLAFLNRGENILRFGRGSRLLSISVITLVICCATRLQAVPPALPLHTLGANIVDNNGTRVRLNAFNWYGAESADYVVAGLQIAPLQSIVNEIKGLGFNAVRLPWSNQMFESNPVVQNYALTANPGMEGEAALTILDQVVSALTSAGIMVILDDHNSNAIWCCSTTDGNSLWYNSQYPQANWIADWQGMVQRYQSNPWVIGADLRNEPRGTASWGGGSSTDWHAAAQLGGNAVLSVNPNLLVFVEGVNYAWDLSGVSSLPVQLNVPNQLVYEAHDYGFWYSGLTSYSSYVSTITPKWGYLVSGSNPQPLWVGEFGTCNTSDACVDSNSSGDGGYWFKLLTTYMQEYGVNWSYWAINGTQSTGSSRTYGAAESYGVLNATWDGSALSSLTSRLTGMMPAAAKPGIAIIAAGSTLNIVRGGSGAAVISIVPQNGFTGTVNLSCSLNSPSGAIGVPTCNVPGSETLAGTSPVNATVSISTAGGAAGLFPNHKLPRSVVRFGDAVLACAFLFAGNLSRRRKSMRLFLIATVAVLSVSACGGKGSAATVTTPPGAYTITVSGSATGVSSVTTQISISVQ